MEEITRRLFEMQDVKYRDFQAKLIPNIPKEKIIGVRTPMLRAYAKELQKAGPWREFLKELPHPYQEENMLHDFLIAGMKAPIEEVLGHLEKFLPHVDNWAVCDSISPKLFKKYPEEVYERVKQWLKSDPEYTVRFGIVTLLQFFLDEEFRPEMLELVKSIHREEYYINMAVAWYFSFALIKQYDTTIPLIEGKTMAPWVHNKSIQKAIESYRISDERKNYLRTLKMPR